MHWTKKLEMPRVQDAHHKISNIFQSEKRPDFDVKILRDYFLTNTWYIE